MNSSRDSVKDAIRDVLLQNINHDDGTLVAGEEMINDITYEIADAVFDVLGIEPTIQDMPEED